MTITPVKTDLVVSGALPLADLLVRHLPAQLPENSIVAITSKIVSLCEGRTVPLDKAEKAALIKQESDYYSDPIGPYGFHFTLTNNTLIPAAGIDESNSDGSYVLWPADAQQTAVDIWHFLRQRYSLQHVGVLITDSTCKPLRRGTTGIALAHCGFEALHSYVGQPDLFGRPFQVSQANNAEGLAAAAVVGMGEGTEQTPLCVISDLPQVTFQDQPPSAQELREVYIPMEEDIFAPFIQAVDWHPGQKGGADDR